MIKTDEKSNAQGWELEIACKNKKYLDAIVGVILKYGMLSFEVESTDCHSNHDGWDGRYLVLIWCSWFSNLQALVNDLAKIEEEFEGFADVPK
jgi:hypothetical protein